MANFAAGTKFPICRSHIAGEDQLLKLNMKQTHIIIYNKYTNSKRLCHTILKNSPINEMES